MGYRAFKDIQKELCWDKRVLSREIQKLKLMNLIEEVPYIGDLRIKRYRLTDELVVLTKEQMLWLVQRELGRRLTDDEIEALLKISPLFREVMILNLIDDREFSAREEIFNILSMFVILDETIYSKDDIRSTLNMLGKWVKGIFRVDYKVVDLVISQLDMELPKSLLEDWERTEHHSSRYGMIEMFLSALYTLHTFSDAIRWLRRFKRGSSAASSP